MFTIIKDKNLLHPSLQVYINTEFVQSFQLVCISKKRARYEFTFGGNATSLPGIHFTLKRRFYPNYKYPTTLGRKRQKKGSSKKIGIATMKALMKYVATKKIPDQWRAKELIKYWEKTLEHIIQAVELPVYVAQLKCVTQANVECLLFNKL